MGWRLPSVPIPGHEPGWMPRFDCGPELARVMTRANYQRTTDAARVSRSKVHARPPCSEKRTSVAIAAGAKESYARISYINRDREGWRGWMAVCAYLPAFDQALGGWLGASQVLRGRAACGRRILPPPLTSL